MPSTSGVDRCGECGCSRFFDVFVSPLAYGETFSASGNVGHSSRVGDRAEAEFGEERNREFLTFVEFGF